MSKPWTQTYDITGKSQTEYSKLLYPQAQNNSSNPETGKTCIDPSNDAVLSSKKPLNLPLTIWFSVIISIQYLLVISGFSLGYNSVWASHWHETTGSYSTNAHNWRVLCLPEAQHSTEKLLSSRNDNMSVEEPIMVSLNTLWLWKFRKIKGVFSQPFFLYFIMISIMNIE